MVLPASHRISRVPWYSGSDVVRVHLSSTGLSPALVCLPRHLRLDLSLNFIRPSATPRPVGLGLGSFPFARRYSENRLFYFSSSGYLDVSVHRVPPVRLCIHLTVLADEREGVSPFGHPRIIACLRLHGAFRSLPRPSSAPSAKASALCSYLLDLLHLESAIRSFKKEILSFKFQLGFFLRF